MSKHNTLKWFQEESVPRTMNTNLNVNQLVCNMAMGLAGEAGEVVDYLKKDVFHKHPFDKKILVKELGDVLYYLCAIANLYEIDMETVAFENDMKLQLRYPSGFSIEDSIARRDKDV